MKVMCVECNKEAEEMRQFEDEIYMCEWCYGNIQAGITKIIIFDTNDLLTDDWEITE